MDFDLTDDQRLLGESVARLLADEYAFDQRKKLLGVAPGWSEALWARYAELGLLGLPIPEEYGGFGGGAVDVMLLQQAFGRHLVLEPFLATVVLGATAIREAGDKALQEEFLPAIAAGECKLAFAHYERQSRYDITDVLTTATPRNGGWVLEGGKSVVLHGDCADKLVVSARTGGSREEAEGISLFLVEGEAEGLLRRGYALRDGTRAAELSLSGAAARLIGPKDQALPIVERVVQAGIAAMAGEVIGAMEAMQAMTLDYLKTRQQFGRPIGDNQALQHRAAEMLVAMEQGRSMAMLAAMSLSEADPAERARSISMAKVGVGQAGRFVSQNAVQLHGGIGMTDEYAVGHYFRRVMVIEHMFGDTAWHLDRLADQVQ
ncbi:acyl-CoA dehydrogenase family protein [Siccirubricoccus sp. KC 17139]|uniref:Acyl-CoA dehydrogenase family protein n=1 Tax=Siccirubricoccus soli TaxID=2899147 RepID=A0ABT1DAJ6_9PROT|nr:acyl-CoA dehydrogenase family protein [Siccirubricoccus soli]MCO6418959.1 acyl-CoA dehydrogenase family protein [Siccirubricoccus soli]MCP2685094.1 acyl-CoA dehydrogenase family protein [Siccirubricoccus soli]